MTALPKLAFMTASACLSATAFADELRIDFVDINSEVRHATLTFPDGGDGQAGSLKLEARWCAYESTQCLPAILPVPALYRQLFEVETEQPVEIDIANGVIIRRNPVYGVDAELEGNLAGTSNMVVRREYSTIVNGQGLALPPVEEEAARIFELKPVDGNGQSAEIRFPRSKGGLGEVLLLPRDWCGEGKGCRATSVEFQGEILDRWVTGQPSEDEPFMTFLGPYTINLFRSGTLLEAQITGGSETGTSVEKRYRLIDSAATPTSIDKTELNEPPASTAFDCTFASEPSIGGMKLYIFRQPDDVCIGQITWPVIPDPVASLTLTDGWCGQGRCGASEMQSAPFDTGTRPTSFTGKAEGAISITYLPDQQDGAAVISSGAQGVLVKVVNSWRQEKRSETSEDGGDTGGGSATGRLKITDLQKPLGIYALVQGRAEASGMLNIGENLCMMSPLVFPDEDQIWIKSLGVPKDGNPYVLSSWAKCDPDGDRKSCAMQMGTPDNALPTGEVSRLLIEPVGAGNFSICGIGGEDNCGLLYACVHPGGELAHDRTFPSTGANVTDAILARWDGRPSQLSYPDNETILIEER